MTTEFPDINLTNATSRAKRTWHSSQSPRTILWGVILVGLVLILPLAIVKVYNERQLSRLREAVETERARIEETESLLTEYETLVTSIHTTLENAVRLERLADAVEREGEAFSNVLQAITTALPPRVSLTSVVETDDAIIVQGEAGSASLALEFARTLQTQPFWKRVRLEKIEENVPDAPPSSVVFHIRLEK
nr:PilN domain-containing protein [Ardenticatena sp.]